ncbi:MAG TPA: 3TM-type holin [Croceibacterium sp.]|nr:3TM-type holin [Croceibacterium sp.]
MQQSQTQLSAIVAHANSCDPWTSRARPSFLYVRYVMILWALPMGVLSAFRPDTTRDIAIGMNAYLGGLPEQLYTLSGTGYLGYTAMRQLGEDQGRGPVRGDVCLGWNAEIRLMGCVLRNCVKCRDKGPQWMESGHCIRVRKGRGCRREIRSTRGIGWHPSRQTRAMLAIEPHLHVAACYQ